MARYDTQDSSGFAPNDTVVPALVNSPTLFIAPSDRAIGELWIAVSCNDTNYGGCYILASNDGIDYRRIGTLYGSAQQGVLIANLASATDLDVTNTLSIDVNQSGAIIESVDQQSFDVQDSLCYAGGEFIAYKTAVNTGTGLYDLTHLQRGLYGSTPGALTGDDFVLVDDSVFRYRFNKKMVGKTIHLKFRGFNTLKAGFQDVAGLDAYSFMITSAGGVVVLSSDLTPITESIASLTLIKFLNSTNRLAALEYIDSTHQAVAHTFTAASIGQRGYDMDTKTFWDVSDVVDGAPSWVGAVNYTAGDNITIVDNVINAVWTPFGGSTGELLMYGGFNEDIDYHEGTGLVPNFLAADDGDLYYY